MRLISLLLTLLLFTGCEAVSFLSSDDDPTHEGLELEIEQQQIGSLSELKATFSISNLSDQEKTYSFSSGCQYGYTISKVNEDHVLYDSRKNIGCIQVLTSFNLKPGERKSFFITPRFSENAADALPEGTYILTAFLLNNQSQTISKPFAIQ